MSIKQQTEKEMQGALDHLVNELKNIRTGRASPGMVENINIDVYGTQMRLKDIASINAPEPRQLVITPFDPKNSASIGKSIQNANIGLNPIVEANLVRIRIPAMDDSIRKEMIKLLHKRVEEAKVSIRQVRAKFNKLIQKDKSEGNIPEDAVHRFEKEIQDLTDKFCKKTDELAEIKEREVSTI